MPENNNEENNNQQNNRGKIVNTVGKQVNKVKTSVTVVKAAINPTTWIILLIIIIVMLLITVLEAGAKNKTKKKSISVENGAMEFIKSWENTVLWKKDWVTGANLGYCTADGKYYIPYEDNSIGHNNISFGLTTFIEGGDASKQVQHPIYGMGYYNLVEEFKNHGYDVTTFNSSTRVDVEAADGVLADLIDKDRDIIESCFPDLNFSNKQLIALIDIQHRYGAFYSTSNQNAFREAFNNFESTGNEEYLINLSLSNGKPFSEKSKIADNYGWDVRRGAARLYLMTNGDCYAGTGEIIEVESYEESFIEVSEEGQTQTDINLSCKNVSALIEKCKIVDDKVNISGSITGAVSAPDNTVYLFELQPSEYPINGITGKTPIAQTAKSSSFNFNIDLKDGTTETKLYSKFILAVKQSEGNYTTISEACYITNPYALAESNRAFPTPETKKGVRYDAGGEADLEYVEAKCVGFNLRLDFLWGGNYQYTYNGKTYGFSDTYVKELDRIFGGFASNDMTTTVILLLGSGCTALESPHANGPKNSSNYSALNTETKEGIENVTAAIHFLAERYSPGGTQGTLVANWRVGNEINDPKWNGQGNLGFNGYALAQARQIRIVYNAIASYYGNARVYTSLDHYWNTDVNGRFNARDLLKQIQLDICTEGTMFWEIAYNAYPAELTNAKFWNDFNYSNFTNSIDTEIISFMNLNVLTDFMEQDFMSNPDGNVKHLILAEQGFTAAQGEDVQAAAYAYSYFLIENNDYVDEYLYHRQTDHEIEIKHNPLFTFGIWASDFGRARQIREVIKDIDKPNAKTKFEYLLPIINNATSWEQLGV